MCSEITISEAIKNVLGFSPVKIVFNDKVLYNDNFPCEESYPIVTVIPSRIRKFKDSIVTSINIEIVDFHHSIITMSGEYKETADR